MSGLTCAELGWDVGTDVEAAAPAACQDTNIGWLSRICMLARSPSSMDLALKR